MGGQPLGHGAVAAPPHRDAIRSLARPRQERARALNLRPEQRDARQHRLVDVALRQSPQGPSMFGGERERFARLARRFTSPIQPSRERVSRGHAVRAALRGDHRGRPRRPTHARARPFHPQQTRRQWSRGRGH